jgi:hypothetical protein
MRGTQGSPGVWLQRSARLLWIGVRTELRSRPLRIAAAATGVVTAGLVLLAGALPGSLGLLLTAVLGRLYAFFACLWLGRWVAAAERSGRREFLAARPVDGADTFLIAWATGLSLWLALLAVPFLLAALLQLPGAGLAAPGTYLAGYFRAAAIVALLGTFSFALSWLLRSPMGAVATVLFWFPSLLGVPGLPDWLRPETTRAFLPLAALAGMLLVTAGWFVERRRRGELRRPLGPALALGALAVAVVAGGVQASRPPAPMFQVDRALADRIRGQQLVVRQRAPGFWLPDGKGGVVETSAQPGKILLICLFDPQEPETVQHLALLERLHREYGARGVLPIGVCISDDPNDAAVLAHGGYHFPIGWDRLESAPGRPVHSAVADAYGADSLPLLCVTDRRRRVFSVLPDPSPDLRALRSLVEKHLKWEPK